MDSGLIFKLFGVLAIIIGIVDILFPKVTWTLNHKWKYNADEPSDTFLLFTRCGGVITILLGVAVMLYAI